MWYNYWGSGHNANAILRINLLNKAPTESQQQIESGYEVRSYVSQNLKANLEYV